MEKQILILLKQYYFRTIIDNNKKIIQFISGYNIHRNAVEYFCYYPDGWIEIPGKYEIYENIPTNINLKNCENYELMPIS